MSLVHYAIQTAVHHELESVRGDWDGFAIEDVPLLAALVATHPGPRRRQELKRLLLDLIDPPAIDGSRVPLEKRDALDTGMMGRIIFGEAPAFEHVRASYDPALCKKAVHRYDAAAAIRGRGKGTLMRTATKDRSAPPGLVFLAALEEQLAVLIEQLPAIEVDLVGLHRPIQRAELADARAVLEQRRRLWISGEPGTGQTAFATQLARLTAPTTLRIEWGEPELDGSSVYADQIRRAVRTVISPRENSVLDIERALTALLRSRSDLAVVLDGFPVGKVRELVPAGGNAFVICVGNEPQEDWPVVTLGDLSHDEAITMLGDRLPGLDESELDGLIDSVGTRPAMIELSARSIREGYFSIETLRDAAYSSVVDGVDAVSMDPSKRSISRHYVELLEGLSDDDREVLTRLAWFTSGAVRAKTAASLVADHDERSKARYAGALARLSRLGVVRVDETLVSVSSLTRRVVRSLTAAVLNHEAADLLERCKSVRAVSDGAESTASLLAYEVETLDSMRKRFHAKLQLRAIPLDRHHFLTFDRDETAFLIRVREGDVKIWDHDAPGFRKPESDEVQMLREASTPYHLVEAAYCIAPPSSGRSWPELNPDEVSEWFAERRLPFDPSCLFSRCCNSRVDLSAAACPSCSRALPPPAVLWAAILGPALESIPNLAPAKYEGWERDFLVLYAAAAWCASARGDEIAAARYARDVMRLCPDSSVSKAISGLLLAVAEDSA